jgi:hypothetical protein
MRNMLSTSTLVLTLGLLGAAQGTTLTQREGEITARVSALMMRLDYRDTDPADKDRYFKDMDDVTAGVRGEIDNYLQSVVDPREPSQQIQSRLRKLLPRTPNPLYGDAPFVQVAELPTGRSLLVAYTIVRPPHHNWATVRGYLQTSDRFQFMGETARDFDGFNMFKRELRSPIPGELWLMAWGQSEGGNGKIVRFRVYAFDGRSFRTVWNPADMFDANVSFSDSRFVIDHYQRPYEIHDQYLLTPDGVLKTP